MPNMEPIKRRAKEALEEIRKKKPDKELIERNLSTILDMIAFGEMGR